MPSHTLNMNCKFTICRNRKWIHDKNCGFGNTCPFFCNVKTSQAEGRTEDLIMSGNDWTSFWGPYRGCILHMPSSS